MKKILRYWEWRGRHGYTFYCPGCKLHHTINTDAGHPAWQFNGNQEKPTFSPSILVTIDPVPDAGPGFEEFKTKQICHSYVTDGQIQFLSDCTHKLAGQTVQLPYLPDNE